MKIAKYKGVNKIKNSSEKVDWIIVRIQEQHFRRHHTLRYFKIISCFLFKFITFRIRMFYFLMQGKMNTVMHRLFLKLNFILINPTKCINKYILNTIM